MKQNRNSARKSERGNVFFTLFGAVAIVGVLGAGIMATMRGPLTTMVEVNHRAQAESEMNIASKLALLEAVENVANGGDCDNDEFVEPLEPLNATPAPTGGGQLPPTIGSNKEDPWGTPYGYCVWDAGAVTGDAACDGADLARLSGNALDDGTYPVIALISAGPDRTFQTTCAGDPALEVTKAAGSDDIINSQTYNVAAAGSGGLWSIKSGDADTAEIAKDLEVQGTAKFSSGIDLSDAGFGPSAQLKLGAASMLLPTEAALATCSVANVNVLRVNTTTDPDSLEVCDDASDAGTGPFTWQSVAAGAAGVGLWKNDGPGGATGEIYYSAGLVGVGTNNPAQELDVIGDIQLTENVNMANTKSVVWASGASIVEAGGGMQLNANGGVGVELDIDASAVNMSANAVITGTVNTNASDALTVENSDGTDILIVQNDGNVGIGDANPNDALDVGGNVGITGNVEMSNSQGVYWLDGGGSPVAGIQGFTSGGSLILGAGGTDMVYVDDQIIGVATPAEAGNTLTIRGATADAAQNALQVQDSLAAQIFVIENDGDVGIGVADPSEALDVAGNIEASGNITGADLLATSEIFVAGTLFGPAEECLATQKLEWDDSSGWSCETDLQGGAGGAGQNLEEVLDVGDDAGGNDAQDFDQVGANEFCNANLTVCFTPGDVVGVSDLWEDVSNVVRTTSAVDYTAADFVFGSPQLADDGTAGHESRFFFDKSKAAFRAGQAQGTQWDDANVGVTSMAWGFNTRASGIGTTAWGENSIASNDNATAWGLNTTASGTGTTAWGASTTAGNNYSTAFGHEAQATGPYSVAIGMGDASTATFPIVSGTGSLGIFMGDQQTVNVATNNLMALLGGRLIIDPDTTSATNVATSTGGEQNLTVDVHGAVGADYFCDEAGNDCFQPDDLSTAGLWTPDGTNNYIEYDDALGGVRIGAVAGQPAPETDWHLNVGTSTVYTNTNTVAIGGTATSTGGEEDLELDVTGEIGAELFCDEGGNNCFDAADVTGISISPTDDREVLFNSGGELASDDVFVFTSAGNLGIGTTTPTERFEVGSIAGEDAVLQLSDDDINQGVTLFAPANTFGRLEQYNNLAGGLLINGFIDTGFNNVPAVTLKGMTNSGHNANVPAILLTGLRGDVVGNGGDMAAGDTLLQIRNGDGFGGTNLVTVLGSGAVGIGDTTPNTGTGGALLVDVEGNLGAGLYCDENGNNCFEAATAAGASPGLPDRSVQFNSGGAFTGDADFIFDVAPYKYMQLNGRLGVNVLPVADFHIHYPNNGPMVGYLQTDIDTGTTLADGFQLGFDASENVLIANKENTGVLFSTNNLERMRLSSAGQLLIGATAAPSPVSRFYVRGTDTSTTAGRESLADFSLNYSPSGAAPTRTVQGIESFVDATGANDKGTVRGIAGFVDNYGAGAFTTVAGVYATGANFSGAGLGTNIFGIDTEAYSSGGTVTNVAAINAEANVDGTVTNNIGVWIKHSDSGTITNRYGVKIDNYVGAATNDYGIYQEGGTLNYFADAVGIADATPNTGTGGALLVDVEGNLGAGLYCDENGNNCFEAAAAAGATPGAPDRSIQFNSGGAFTGDAGFTFDTDGAVHIASDNPDVLFDIPSSSAFVASNLGFSIDSTERSQFGLIRATGDTYLAMDADNDTNGAFGIRLTQGGTDLFRFTSSGRLGVGTVTPAAKMHVYDANSANLTLQTTANNSSPLLSLLGEPGAAGQYLGRILFDNTSGGTEGVEIRGVRENNGGFQSELSILTDGPGAGDLAERMRITSYGTGIGDATPNSGTGGQLLLDVEGNIGGALYCDENGNNCFESTDVSGATDIWEDVSGTGDGPVRPTSGTINYASADFLFGSPQLDNDGNGAHNSRMFFDKSASAFRAGAVTGGQWDAVNLGLRSAALGENVTASGAASAAFGAYTTAAGSMSMAWGGNAVASGANSMAGGNATVASGGYSAAWGNANEASGIGATAWGNLSSASGNYSTAFGTNTLASLANATAWGEATQATAGWSTAWGYGSIASAIRATAFGNMTLASGPYSTAWGSSTTASADYSTAWGNANEASGIGSTAWGNLSSASGNYATAFGNNTNANGTGAMAWGTGTSAGLYATAFGNHAVAQGDYSVAWGNYAMAEGDYATGFGTGDAQGDYSMSWGSNYSSATAESSTAWGSGSVASGQYSTAWGEAYAQGIRSTAWGRYATAIGVDSTAFGMEVEVPGDLSVGIGFNDNAGPAMPVLSGDGSFGLFMGDQTGVDVTANNLMALLGGKMVIDPDTTSATNISAATGGEQDLTLEVTGAIGTDWYCDAAGNNCFNYTDLSSAGDVWEDVSGTGAGPVRPTSGTINYASADFLFGSPTLAGDGNAAHNYRMFFDKSKGAFRAGGALNTEWDDANVGIGSIALGYRTTASGAGSVAIGERSTASGFNSFALASWGTASNDYSTVLGASNTSSGYASIVWGENSSASGNAATAGGRNATASGATSTAFGDGVWASGVNSMATGRITQASGIDSFAIGREVRAGTGTPNAALNAGHGNNTVAIGLLNAGQATDPMVTGDRSMGIFMGNGANAQSAVNLATSDTLALIGGRMIINPTTGGGAGTDTSPATGGAQDVELNVLGDIGATNYCDVAGNNCFTAASIAAGGIWEDAGDLIRPTSGVVNYESADFLFGSTQLDDVVGQTWDDHRMFFDKSKGAFRVGRTDPGFAAGTWNDANVGIGSTAFGYEARASGGSSVAIGDYQRALGGGTIAIGRHSESSGEYSITLGTYLETNGPYSTAIGYGANTGDGNQWSGAGEFSIAMGLGEPTTTNPTVSGIGSLGIFMGDQDAVDITANNMMALLGGRLVIDPDTTSAANVATSTGGEEDLELDVAGDIGADNYCDAAGNNCFNYTDLSSAGDVWEDVSGTGAGPIRSTSGTINYASADFLFGAPALGDNSDADYYSQMFFDKSKGAFRAGETQYNNFLDANVGYLSAAFGNSTASEGWTMAWGGANIADGQGATAGGMYSEATGQGAVAIGWGLLASGDHSVALGGSNSGGVISSGTGSMGWGRLISASGDYSTAFGEYSSAEGDYAISGGYSNVASGQGAVSLGYDNTVNHRGVGIGTGNTALWDGSYAVGWHNTTGLGGVALGTYNISTGFHSVAIGTSLNITGDRSGGLGLSDDPGSGPGFAGNPTVSGDYSYGVFMGDQENVNVAANNTVAFLGGTIIVDPDATSATNVAASTGGEQNLVLDVTGAIGATHYCDTAGNNCFDYTDLSSAGDVWEDASDVIRSTSGTVNYTSADFVFGSPQLADTGNAAHDRRMYFDKSTGAFRAGSANSTEWNNPGNYSAAFGLNSIASGSNAMAWGVDATASGDFATAFGQATTAGDWATAWGGGSDATGQHSTAFGLNSLASGARATAWGNGSEASGTGSTAWGTSTSATGLYSTAFGDNTTASGNNTVAMGTGAIASGTGSISIGTNTNSSADHSIALGYGSAASGSQSIAMGYVTAASGGQSTAIGIGTNASGSASFAVGNSVRAGSGTPNVALGGGHGNYTMAVGLLSGSQATLPRITGDRSMGIFMGAGNDSQSAVAVSGSDTLALIGGKMIINPSVGGGAGTDTTAATGGEQDLELNVLGDVGATNYCDAAGNNCFAAADMPGTFLDLTDTPSNYAAAGGFYVRVNAGATALEFTDQLVGTVSGQPAPGFMGIDDLSDVTITAASNGECLTYNGTAWVDGACGGTASAATPNRGIQYNSGGVFGATANFTYTSAGRMVLTTANQNVFITGGVETTAGLNNTALGQNALDSLDATCAGGSDCDFNTAIGHDALTANTIGTRNTALGTDALQTNTTGSQNTALGYGAMEDSITADSSVAIGINALGDATDADQTVAIGAGAMGSPITADNNTAVGYSALSNNTAASLTGVGWQALSRNTTGTGNVGFGQNAGRGNQTGTNNTSVGQDAGRGVDDVNYSNNTLVGYRAGFAMTSGSNNVAVGASALIANTYGTHNTALGANALDAVTSGSSNTALGYEALTSITTSGQGTAVGYRALRLNTGNANTAVGYTAGHDNTTGIRNTYIGNAVADNNNGSDNVMIGNLAGQGVDTVTATSFNVFVGARSALAVTTGANNTMIGYQAGDSVTTGADNILIGYNVDLPTATTNQYLNIGNILFGDIGTTSADPRIGAHKYCDENLANCFEATDVGGGGAIWTDSGAGYIEYSSALGGARIAAVAGAAAPVYPNLSVTGSASAAAPSRSIQFNSGGTLGGASTFVYGTGGNIGLGTATPATGTKMHVYNTGGETAMILEADEAYEAHLYLLSQGDGATNIGQAATRGWEVGVKGASSSHPNDFRIGHWNGSAWQDYFTIDSVTGNVGLHTVVPTYTFALGGNAARTIGMERHTTADTAGNNLTISAGGATTGATNKNGGTLNLDGGIATGTGDSNILLNAYRDGTLRNIMTVDGDKWSVKWGSGNTIGYYASTAWGENNTANGYGATAWGNNTDAVGADATSWGANTQALDNQATAWGNNTRAITDVATSWGADTLASGWGSTAWGYGSVASGYNSTAWGEYTSAIGDMSTTFGQYVEASGEGSVAIGLFSPVGASPVVSGDGSMGIFIGDQSGYDLSAPDTFALIGGEFQLDDVGSSANKGCLRYNSATTKLQFSHDCSAYSDMGTATVTPASPVRGIQFNSGGALSATANFTYTSGGRLVLLGSTAGATNTFITGGVETTPGLQNVALGVNALDSLDATCTNGGECDYNVAIGYDALTANTIGGQNVGIGQRALQSNTTGGGNTVVGREAMRFSTGGYDNVAIGVQALYTGSTNIIRNVAVGGGALRDNLGIENTAVGVDALFFKGNGDQNVAIGRGAGYGVNGTTSTANNVFIGYRAGYAVTTGGNNTLIGHTAGDSLTTGANNILIGYNIDLPAATTSNRLNIGGILLGDMTGGSQKVGAHQYCDENLANCFEASGVGGGLWEDASNVIRPTSGTVNYASADFLFGAPEMDYDSNPDHAARVFFNKDLAAFRAGWSDTTAWDEAGSHIGGYSIGLGYNTEANGSYSTAFGNATMASGNTATAWGYQTTASGGASTAFGDATLASGDYTTAWGASTEAAGEGATAWGTLSSADGNYSTAFGNNTTATGVESTAWGFGTVAEWDQATAFGWNTRASGDTSTAWGSETHALGQKSTAFGSIVRSTGDFTLAVGLQSASQATIPEVTGTRSAVFFFDGGVANANSAYDFVGNDKFAIIGGEFQIDNQSSTANKGCIRYDSATTKLQFSHDCSTYADMGGGSGTASGDDTEIQYNSGDAFAASSDFTYNDTTKVLNVNGTVSAATKISLGMTSGANTPEGMALDDLTDVSASSPSNGQILSYNGTNWVASTASTSASGVAGSVQFSNGTNLASDATNFFWDDTSNELGIGTNSPNHMLDVRGAGSFWGNINAITIGEAGGNTAGYIQATSTASITIAADNEAGSYVRLKEGGTGGIMVYHGGNVAIGTTTTAPTYNLSFGGNSAQTIAMERHTTADTAGNNLTLQAGGATSGATNKAGGNLVLNSGIATGTGDSSILLNTYLNGAQSTTMTLDGSTGFVGIGDTTPTEARLVVQGSTNDNTAYALSVRNSTPTEMFYIRNDGVVFINTMLYLAANATIQSQSSGAAMTFVTGGGNSGNVTLDTASATGTTRDIVFTPGGQFVVTGDIEYSGTITDTSDIRLKDNIHPLSERGSMLAKLGLIDTYSFTMKDDAKKQVEFGVIAQEIEKVFPELVRTSDDEMGTKSVNYIGLIAPMIEAGKELEAENKAMKAEIAELKAGQAKIDATLASLTDQVELLNKAAGSKAEKAGMDIWTILAMIATFGASSLCFLLGGILRTRKKTNG